MRSIRSKFTSLIIFILVLTVSSGGYFLIANNIQTLTKKIQDDALNYAEFSAPTLGSLYQQDFLSGGFVPFRQKVTGSLERSSDIFKVRVVSKKGVLLYDSFTDTDKPYDGPERSIYDSSFLLRLKDVKPSLELKDGSIVYVQRDPQGAFKFVDSNEIPVTETLKSRIVDVVYPFSDNTFGIEYFVTYENADNIIIGNVVRILAVLAAGIFVAFVFSVFFVRRIVRPIEILTKGAEAVAAGDLETRVSIQSNDEVGVLADTFNHMVKDLKKNTKELLDKERLDHEISLAADIQRDLIPKQIPKVMGMDIAASVLPATEIGGDCYDFIQKEENLMIFIGDVTGHGVSAGLVEAITSSLVYTFATLTDNTHELITGMNKVIHKKTRPNVFVTSIMGMWNSTDHCFRYTNAGHDPVIHYNSSQKKAAMITGNSGIALGMIPDITLMVVENEVCPAVGDLLVLYTDGIPEAWDEQEKQLGGEAFLRIIEQNAHLPNAQAVHDAIIRDIRVYMGSRSPSDDVTLIVMKKV